MILLRQRAGVAILALTIEWASAHGLRSPDAGRTGSFCNNGLQQFRRKRGLTPADSALQVYAANELH